MSLNLDKTTWQRVKFGDVIDSITDRVDNPSEAGVDRYVGLEHLDPGMMTVQRWDSPDKVEAQKLRFQPGDVIFGRRRAYQKKVAVADFEGICSAHALVLRARPEKILPEFLPIFLSSDYFLDRAISISVGSLSPTINWRDLKVQEFDLPPLPEQKRLADLLWAVEEQKKAESSRYSALANCRDKYVEELLSKGKSQQVRLETLVKAGTIITYGIVQAGPEVDEGIPYIRVTDMTGGVLSVKGMKRTAPEIAARFQRSRVETGDLVVALRGRTGLTLKVPDELDGANLTQGTARVAIDPQMINPDYVMAVMNSKWMSAEINRHAKGSTFTELTLVALRNLPIPRFSLIIEDNLLNTLNSLDTANSFTADSMAALNGLRDTLLSEIFGGPQ